MKLKLTELTPDHLTDFCQQRLQPLFTTYLADISSPELKNAMQHTLLNGGKYLRPALIYATGSIFDANLENLDIPAAAVEVVHTYSLIHDDLPCMDNAALRRGKPTCHKIYGEGMAVLAGDALHTLAMQIIAMHPAPLKSDRRLQMIKALSSACGPYGMAAGQALDITLMTDKMMTADLLIDIYRLKTGALFSACIELGRLASGDDDDNNQQALKEFGACIGLAFQIQDDILDMESTTALLGKQQGTDAKNHKITYPNLLGLPAAKEKVQSLYLESLESINYLGQKAALLRELAKKMVG